MSEDERGVEPNKKRWLSRDDLTRNDLLELILDELSAMEEPLRERWVAAINTELYGFRRIEPDRELDPTDETIPKEMFAIKLQMYLTDEGEFSSILVTAPRKRRWLTRRQRSES